MKFSDGVNTQISSFFEPFFKTRKVSNYTQTKLPCNFDSVGFNGYETIKDSTERQWKSLAGISMEVYLLLLNIMMTVNLKNCKFSIENRLLLFLMKMKTGLSYTALSVIFSCNRITVSTIFRTTLLFIFTNKKVYFSRTHVITCKNNKQIYMHIPSYQSTFSTYKLSFSTYR